MYEYKRTTVLTGKDKNLITAVREGQLETVRQLIEGDRVFVDFQESEGSATALMTAAQKGFVDILKYLLVVGANPNIQDREQKTALIVAVMNNHIACIKPLMEHGADPNLFSKNGWTPLYIAANKGYLDVVKALVGTYGVLSSAGENAVSHKLKIDMRISNNVGGNVLMVACMQGHKDIVECLTGLGADVNAADNNKWTALMKAADKGHTEVVAHLIKQGATVTDTDTSNATALHLAAKAGASEAIKVLLSHPHAAELINKQDTNGRTPLFYAAQNGHLEAVKVLMEHGADVSILDRMERTALTVAKDPTGQIQEELSKVVIPVASEKNPDAQTEANSPSLTEKMQKLNVDVVNPCFDAAQSNSKCVSNSLPAHVPAESVLSHKRSREEEDEGGAVLLKTLQQLDADFSAALWCGDTQAAARVEAEKSQGNLFATAYLAILYHYGCHHVRVDRALASQYALSAVPALENADQTSKATAQFLLGMLFYEAIGAAQDLNRALDLFNEAAAMAHTNAIYMVGLYYMQSEDSAENHEQALSHFRAASDKQHPRATFELGYLYIKGNGVEKDLAMGFQYFKKAGQLGCAWALTNIGTCYKHGKGVEKNEKEAVKYFQFGADRGDPYGTYHLGTCYEKGIGGTIVDVKRAAELYTQAAELGHAKAQVNLGLHYLNGTGSVQPSDCAARFYFQRAAEQDDAEGLYRLGVCYMLGRGVAKDINVAIGCLERATAQSHACARIDLAFCLVCSRGDEDDFSRARTMMVDIFANLVNTAHSAGLPALAVLVPRWETVDVAGYAMIEASSEYALHFLDNTSKKLIPEKRCDISASRQWLMDAAPVLKAGLLWLNLYGDRQMLPHVGLAMSVLQEMPGDIGQSSRDVYCAGNSEAIIRHAYAEIYRMVEETGKKESEPMATET